MVSLDAILGDFPGIFISGTSNRNVEGDILLPSWIAEETTFL